jgi:hypothetical protein
MTKTHIIDGMHRISDIIHGMTGERGVEIRISLSDESFNSVCESIDDYSDPNTNSSGIVSGSFTNEKKFLVGGSYITIVNKTT